MGTDIQKQHKRICFWFVAAGTAFLIMIVLMIVWKSGEGEENRPHIQKSSLSMEAWMCMEEGKEFQLHTFPYEVHKKEGVFYYQIPDDVRSEDVLVLENRYQKIRVSLEGKEIYSYGFQEGRRRFMPANIDCYIEMEPEYRGKVLEVKIEDGIDSSNAILYEPKWSNDALILGETIRDNVVSGIFFIIAGIGGCILLIASAVWSVKRAVWYSENFSSLGAFMLLSAVWVLTDSRLLQLCVDNSQLVMIVSFESFFMMPIPFLWFMDRIVAHETKVFRQLRYVFAFNCMIQNLIYLMGISDFTHMVAATHLILFVSITYAVYYMAKEYSHFKLFYAKRVLIGIAGFACMSGISIVSFYLKRGVSNEGFFIGGFALLVLDLFAMSIHKLREFAEFNVRGKIYKELAFQDFLTGLGNRNLYEKQLLKYKDESPDTAFSVAVLDINGLKMVNDTYGHGEGDRLIQKGGECIRRAFEGQGECYRTGGDEFVVLMPFAEADEKLCRRRLQEQISGYNNGQQIQLVMAAGFAVKRDGMKSCQSLEELIKAADCEMYREKKNLM